VLDVPCGFGRHAHALAERGYVVTGVERDATAAAEARAGGVEVHELDLRRLDELPRTFDAVVWMWADELSALSATCGLRLERASADWSDGPPAGEAPSAQYVFRRDARSL
jgi:SAM-dependent methyltransferase